MTLHRAQGKPGLDTGSLDLLYRSAAISAKLYALLVLCAAFSAKNRFFFKLFALQRRLINVIVCRFRICWLGYGRFLLSLVQKFLKLGGNAGKLAVKVIRNNGGRSCLHIRRHRPHKYKTVDKGELDR